MDGDSESPWTLRLAKAIGAHRKELIEILSKAGIPPINAEEFIVDAIQSISIEKWKASVDVFGLLRHTLKQRVRSHGKLYTEWSPPGKQTKAGKETTSGKDGDCDSPKLFVLSLSKL